MASIIFKYFLLLTIMKVSKKITNKKYLKNEENNNESIENKNLIDLILKNLPEKLSEIKNKLVNHEKYILKLKNLIKYKDFAKIHITNWKYYLKCYLFKNGINFLSQKNSSEFINLDENIIKEINKIIDEIIQNNKNNKNVKNNELLSENSSSTENKKRKIKKNFCENCFKELESNNDIEID